MDKNALCLCTLVACLVFGVVSGMRLTEQDKDGWDFLEEGVTIHVIARNYDPLGNNISDCLRTRTVHKDNENHIARQVVTFWNHKAGKWMSINQGLVALRNDDGKYNFMKTTKDSAGPAMSYTFLHTEKSCCVMEVSYKGAKRTVLKVEKSSTQEATDGRHCVLWVKEGALDALHTSCEEYFLHECVTEHVYTVHNRTECTSGHSSFQTDLIKGTIG
ncbi:hypothetical protein HPB50_027956 [Hyalomma asiaticum]|nr:hypothetical protein HPB50_027956 [Hyalomma asiaticum]